MEEKVKHPTKCKNESCEYNKKGECQKFTQEQMFYNKIRCEGRKY